MTPEEFYCISRIVAAFLIFGSLVAICLQRHREKLLDQAARNRNAGERFGSWYNKMRDGPEYARIIRVSGHYWHDIMPQWKASERDLAILIADEAAHLPAKARDATAGKGDH